MITGGAVDQARSTTALILVWLRLQATVKQTIRSTKAQSPARQTSITGKITCRGTFGGYEVAGWRYIENATWHVKVWPVGRPRGWIGYRTAVGIFELKIVAQAHKEAILHVIGESEAE
jgi:hypothetical protein